MTTFNEIMDGRKLEMKAILDNLRYQLCDLIDEYWLAWCAAGRPRDAFWAEDDAEQLFFGWSWKYRSASKNGAGRFFSSKRI